MSDLQHRGKVLPQCRRCAAVLACIQTVFHCVKQNIFLILLSDITYNSYCYLVL